MKIHQRIERLEKQFVMEPTILFMPDGKTVSLVGPGDYLLTLVGLAMDLIQMCSHSREPGGSRLVELIQCFQYGPAKVKAADESEKPDQQA
jgi:hypothetical protein